MKRPSCERGFGLVELVIGLLVLSVVVLGLGGATARLNTQMGRSVSAAIAVAHAESRLDRIRIELAYDSLEARFQGVELEFSGLPGATRETRFAHVVDTTAGQVLDYKRVTVTIRAQVLSVPIVRTTAVAAP